MEEAFEDISPVLEKLTKRETNLTFEECKTLVDQILNNKINQPQLVAFLVLLRAKGESYHEIAAFASAMRDVSVKLPHTEGLGDIVDIVGTGVGWVFFCFRAYYYYLTTKKKGRWSRYGQCFHHSCNSCCNVWRSCGETR